MLAFNARHLASSGSSCRKQIASAFKKHAARSKKKERRRAATLDGFGDIPRRNETALMQVPEPNQFIFVSVFRAAIAHSGRSYPSRCQLHSSSGERSSGESSGAEW